MSMLTVKHVEKQCETLTQAHQVVYWQYGKDDGKTQALGKQNSVLEAFGCTIGSDDGATKDGYCCFSSGIVYVMNDAGSTVGIYRLE